MTTLKQKVEALIAAANASRHFAVANAVAEDLAHCRTTQDVAKLWADVRGVATEYGVE